MEIRMANEGCIVIADISGYTVYLNRSELEHAEGILRSLLEVILSHTNSPLVLSRLEGDAVISYALSGGLLQGQSLADKIESTYVAFRRALEQMVVNTTCTCNACRNIGTLDLKFFVHHGRFAVQDVGGHNELLGNDVNLVFRLTKNHITERTGLSAYAAYTAAAVEGLELKDFGGGLLVHRETYEHLGEVEVYVQDMHPVWEARREETMITLPERDVMLRAEVSLPYPPALIWDYLTGPHSRVWLYASDHPDVRELREGRIGAGTVYVCHHGEVAISQTIVEWHPFRQYAYISAPVEGLTTLDVLELEPHDEETRLTIRVSKPRGSLWKRLAHARALRKGYSDAFGGFAAYLKERIEADIASGAVDPAEVVVADPEAVTEAVQSSLASLSS